MKIKRKKEINAKGSQSPLRLNPNILATGPGSHLQAATMNLSTCAKFYVGKTFKALPKMMPTPT